MNDFLQKLTTLPFYLFILFLTQVLYTQKLDAELVKKPNIIVIMADDLGYGDLSCYNPETLATPNCDRLAEEGMLFTDAHSPSAVCTPTRYALLTGRYAWRSWLKDWVINERMPLLIDTKRPTIGSILQEADYTTGCVGKWHLGWGTKMNAYHNGIMKPGPLEVGFDHFFGVPNSHNSEPEMEVFVRGRTIVGQPEGVLPVDADSVKESRRSLEDTAINLSKAAVEFIEENHKKHFFLYYPTTNVHFPITPNERFQGRNPDDTYGAFVAEFDWAVGEVLDALDRLEIADNTLIVVTSDNGAKERFGGNNGPWRGEKAEIHEAGHRVPFLARWPGKIQAGSQEQATICLTDLMPTAAALAGINLPKRAAPDGYDLSPLLFKDSKSTFQRKATVHHSISGMFAIRIGPWKLIEGLGSGRTKFNITLKDLEPVPQMNPETGMLADWSFQPDPFPQPGPGKPAGQLYNLKRDPGETENLYQTHPQIVKRLQKKLDQIRSSGD
ncbi:Arylsulfatase A [Planctomycetales bacterium 10988]|nr:Arylsulfatase A [Planctomycetales bacterium 10988]